MAGLLEGLNAHIDVKAILFNEGILAKRLRRIGVEVHVVRERGSFRDVVLLTKVIQVLKRCHASLIHTHGYKETILGILAGRFVGVRRFVRTEHGAPEPFSRIKKLKMDANLFLDRVLTRVSVDRVISVSEDLRRTLIPQYGAEKVVTIHNGIALGPGTRGDRQKKKIELGVPPDHKIVGTVGRLNPIKGLDHLLEAAKIVLDIRDDVTFLVVGEGPLETELKDLAGRMGIEDHIIFLGFREDVDEVMAAMDVFVLCSLHEGIPLSLLEAMELRLAAVATKVGGIPEVIEDGLSGLLVPPGDEGAMARAISEALSTRGEQLGQEAQRRVRSRFSLETMVERTTAVYRTLLQN